MNLTALHSQNIQPLQKHLLFFLISLIFCTGLHLRVTAVLESEVINPVRADAKNYVLYAANLQKYGIYSRSVKIPPPPDSARPPGYPLFLSLFIKDTQFKRITLTNIQLVQACLSAITILLTFAIFSPILGKTAAFSIATLTAISPHLINLNIYLLSESLFSFFIVFFYWCLTKFSLQNNNSYIVCISGLLLAYASLTRPWCQYFIFFLAPFIFIYTKKNSRIKTTLLLTASFFLLMGIWIIRNSLITEMDSSNSVMINSILHGMYPDLMYQGNPKSYGYPYRFDPNLSEITRSGSTLLSEIMNRFQNAPWKQLKWYLFGKPLNLFSWNYIQGMGDAFIYPIQKSPYYTQAFFYWTHSFMKTTHSALMSLALFGSVVVWFPIKNKKISTQSTFILRSISLLLIYFILIHILVAPLPRYAVPIRPLMYGMALIPLLLMLDWLKKLTNTQGITIKKC